MKFHIIYQIGLLLYKLKNIPSYRNAYNIRTLWTALYTIQVRLACFKYTSCR